MKRPKTLIRRIVTALAICSSVTADATAQSLSEIGDFLFPSGFQNSNPIAVTTDGSQVVFFHTISQDCDFSVNVELSRIRPDGTGYELLLDEPAILAAFPAGFSSVLIEDMRMSGDGRFLTFIGPHTSIGCVPISPFHDMLMNVETGVIRELLLNGFDAGDVSYTDDGSMMVFKGWDPHTNRFGYYRSGPDGVDPELFLDVSEWFVTLGTISGDGSRFAMVGYHAIFAPVPADVYVHEFATGRLTKVTPNTLHDIASVSLSYDGSRVVYGEGAAVHKVHAVKADGSDHHVLEPRGWEHGATITSDGQFVFVRSLDKLGTIRVPWEGGGALVFPLTYNSFTTLLQVIMPVDGTGSLFAGRGNDIGPLPWDDRPLEVAFLDPPALTTSGFLQTGTDLQLDVGGAVGDTYALALSTGPGSQRLGNFGILGLDPSHLALVSSGTITDPVSNTASLTQTIPDLT